MANTIKLKHSDTTTSVPASLQAGELAINRADKKLFFTDAIDAVQSIDLLDNTLQSVTARGATTSVATTFNAQMTLSSATDGTSTPLRIQTTDSEMTVGQELFIDYMQLTSTLARQAMVFNGSGDWGLNFYTYKGGLNKTFTLNGAGEAYFSSKLGIGTAPTYHLHVEPAAPASVATGVGTNAITSLLVVGQPGGNVTAATTGYNQGGSGATISITSGAGGSVSGTPTTGVGGNGGAMTVYAGNGGVGEHVGGAGGSAVLSGGNGGNSGIGGTTGQGGYANIKGGNAGTIGDGNGGDIFMVPGMGNGTGTDGNIYLGVNNNGTLRGNVIVGSALPPTARLEVAAGTATLAPMKIAAGTNLTSPEDGAMEYNGTHLYFTVGSTRYQLDQQSGSSSFTTDVNITKAEARLNIINASAVNRGYYGLDSSGNTVLQLGYFSNGSFRGTLKLAQAIGGNQDYYFPPQGGTVIMSAGDQNISGTKTFTGNVVVQGQLSGDITTTAASATTTVDWNSGNIQKITMGANITTLTLNNAVAGTQYVLMLAQDGTGSRTVTWPATFKWKGGSEPTLSAANKTDIIYIIWDGTNYFASPDLNF